MLTRIVTLAALCLLTACAAKPMDYSAFKEAKPRSILVLPAVNNSVEVNAPYVYLSTITRSIAEQGYYVFPVEVVERYMAENGLQTPEDMHNVSLEKIREHIGADAILYSTINDWGQKYALLSSNTVVDVNNVLIDAKTGTQLWQGRAVANQSSSDGGGGLIGALVGAVASQIAASMSDKTVAVAQNANKLTFQGNRGLLRGPYATPANAK